MTDFLSPETKALLDAEKARKAREQAMDTALFRPLHNGTPTSKAAAERVQPTAGGKRRAVLVALMFAPKGLTRLELVAETGFLRDTVNPRVAELLKAGWATEEGERDGQKVLHITAAGLAVLDTQEAA